MPFEQEEYIYDPDKSALLKQTRGIGFEEILDYLESGALVDVLDHPNQLLHAGQKIYELDIDGYIVVVPFMEQDGRKRLITIYPSRKATRKHKEKHDEKKKK